MKKIVGLMLAAVIAIGGLVGGGLLTSTDVARAVTCNPSGTAAEQAACGIEEICPPGDPGCDPTGAEDQVFSTIQTVFNTVLIIVGILAVVMIIYGGIRYTTSRGDSKATGEAKNTILWAVIGLAVALLALAIVNFVIGALSGGGVGGGSTLSCDPATEIVDPGPPERCVPRP